MEMTENRKRRWAWWEVCVTAMFCSKKEFENDREDEDEGHRCIEPDALHDFLSG